MSPLWSRSGNLAVNPDGTLALVRAWIYVRQTIAACAGAMPSTITIIGCDPPDCVKFWNTNLYAGGLIYARQSCGEWSGTGGYAWPADIPNCPYPNGVSIASADCDTLINTDLTLSAEGEGVIIYDSCPDIPPGYPITPLIKTGRMSSGAGWSTNCGWLLGVSEFSISCAGLPYFLQWFGMGPTVCEGTGSLIPLDDGVPVGTSVIPIYRNHVFLTNLTITTARTV